MKTVKNMLNRHGILNSYKGYEYLAESIRLMVLNYDYYKERFKDRLYVDVSKKFMRSVKTVELGITYCVKKSGSCLTNKQFIMHLASKVINEDR